MKRLTLTALGFIFIAVGAGQANAQNITPAERDVLVDRLQKSSTKLQEATAGLSPEQLKFKPNMFRWSVAECVEHLALAEDFLFNIYKEQIMKAPAPAGPRDPAEVTKTDQGVLKIGTDRSARFLAPEPVQPKKQTATSQELLARFIASRNGTIDTAKTTNDLRNHCAETFLGKCTDGYQFLLLIAAHSERHTLQLLEVKADPRFPKK